MKLKNIVLTTVAATALVAGSSAFAGLQLTNSSSVTSSNIVVSCTGGAQTAPALFNQNVPWSLVKLTFLGGNASSTCTFVDKSTGTQLAKGQISISADNSSGTVNASPIDPNISISPTTGSGADITIAISGNE